MKKGIAGTVICGCLLIAGCITNEGSFWDLKKVDDISRLNIGFSAAELQYRRTGAQQGQNNDGWVESGTWQAEDETGKSEVWIYLASLYEKAFMKKDIRDMQSLARRVSGDSYLDFAEQGKFKSMSGDLEYVFYRASGQPCVLIRKYWSDPETSADTFRAIALEWVSGTNFIYAYYCRSSGAELQKQDMDLLFSGIEAKNLYWPEDMFVNVDETF